MHYAPLLPDPSDWLRDVFTQDDHITVVDMFSGAGGMSFGLDSIPGVHVVAAFEQDPIACETHLANMPAPVICGDVGDVDDFKAVLDRLGVKRIDVLVGGPPCQGFSRLGQGALRKIAETAGLGRDFVDKRNLLFRHFMRAVRQLKPQVVVIENVPAMAEYSTIIDEIEQVFNDLDYGFDRGKVLKASEHDVPQHRTRLFMVANLHGRAVPWPAASGTAPTLRDAIGDLPAVPAAHLDEAICWRRPERESLYLGRMRSGLEGDEVTLVRDHVTRAQRTEDLEAFTYMQEGDRYDAVPKHLRRYREDIFDDKYHRMIWDEPAWTVTAHIAKDGYNYIHPQQHRTLSVREAARIQSFPDQFRFAGFRTNRFKHIGNAVPPLLAQALGVSLLHLVD